MNYGFQSFTADGSIQILNNRFYKLSFKGRYHTNMTAGVPPGALVFMAETDGWVRAVTPPIEKGGLVHFRTIGPRVANFTLYIFVPLENADLRSNFGLQVFNENGVVVWDASAPLLRIVGGDHTANGPPPNNVPIPPGTGKPAVCMLCRSSVSYRPDTGEQPGGEPRPNNWIETSWAFHIEGNRIRTNYATRPLTWPWGGYLGQGLISESATPRGGTLIIADVSNL